MNKKPGTHLKIAEEAEQTSLGHLVLALKLVPDRVQEGGGGPHMANRTPGTSPA